MEGFGIPVGFLSFHGQAQPTQRGLDSQLTSSTPTTNHCCRLREGLETQPASTAFNSLVIDSDISEVTSSSIELSGTGYSLWHGHRRCLRIKDSMPAAQSLCKYTWEVIACMVLIGKGRLGPDIWPGNSWASRVYQRYDEINMEQEDALAM